MKERPQIIKHQRTSLQEATASSELSQMKQPDESVEIAQVTRQQEDEAIYVPSKPTTPTLSEWLREFELDEWLDDDWEFPLDGLGERM